MMDSITNFMLANVAAEFVTLVVSTDPKKQISEEAVSQDLISLGHPVVWSIWVSGQHRQNFEETIKDENTKHWFGFNDKEKFVVVPFFGSCDMSRPDGIQFTVWLASYM